MVQCRGLDSCTFDFYEILSDRFALPAGLGDAATAVGTLFLSVALYTDAMAVSRKSVFWRNTFGLIDFVFAVSLGMIIRPGMGIINDMLINAPMGEFPLALIPGFAAPLFIITHIIGAMKKASQGL